MIQTIKKIFQEKYGSSYRMYAAPGRVNLIGEHTDYNDGYVLPGAIDKHIIVAIAANNINSYRVFAADLNEEFHFGETASPSDTAWANYIIGVVMEIKKRGHHFGGFDAVFGGDIPLGAGMSSSAALESAFGIAINDIWKLGLSTKELAEVGQLAEHNFAGVRCGIMDQFASLHAKTGKLIHLDCRSLDYELIRFKPRGYQLLLIDTCVKHALASSEYNVRRSQCEEGVAIVQKKYPQIQKLRDIHEEMLKESQDEMPEVVYRRCLYVIQENERVLKACKALEQDDFESFGKEMFASHQGLSTLYEVSCERLDFLVMLAQQHQSVTGARMMGGGFGGCTINLIKEEGYEDLKALAASEFENTFGIPPKFYEVAIGEGAAPLKEVL